MKSTEMREAVDDAAETIERADRCATDIAKLLIGRLRHVKRADANWKKDILTELKKELRDFNIQTRKWKGEI